MKQVTLTDECFKLLVSCVEFCIEDVGATGGSIMPYDLPDDIWARGTIGPLTKLRAAIQTGTSDFPDSTRR